MVSFATSATPKKCLGCGWETFGGGEDGRVTWDNFIHLGHFQDAFNHPSGAREAKKST